MQSTWREGASLARRCLTNASFVTVGESTSTEWLEATSLVSVPLRRRASRSHNAGDVRSGASTVSCDGRNVSFAHVNIGSADKRSYTFCRQASLGATAG